MPSLLQGSIILFSSLFLNVSYDQHTIMYMYEIYVFCVFNCNLIYAAKLPKCQDMAIAASVK